jgi:hypothetical protein
MEYQWEFVGCHGGVITDRAVAVIGVENPIDSPGKFTMCQPPADNVLYIYLGTDTYIIYVDR